MIQQIVIMLAFTFLATTLWFSSSGCSRDSNVEPQGGNRKSAASRPKQDLTPRDDLIPVGETAPDFTAKDQQGKTVTLSELLKTHEVVLIFYPADNTPVCTKQLCAVRDDWSKFQQKGATVLGINPASVSRHARFAEKHEFPFPVLSDEDSRISKAYGAGGMIFIQRSVYVIGRDGKVALADRGVVPHDHLLAVLKGS